MADVRVVHTTIELPCLHCGELIAIGTMVHYVGHRLVAHVRCDLRARRNVRQLEAR